METRTVKRLAVLLALAPVLALAWGGLLAQPTAGPAASAVVAPAASAVAAPAAKPARRPLTGQELRDSAQFPQDLEPAAPRPQIKVPLGRKPPGPATAAASAARAGEEAVNTGDGKVNDGVARCKGQGAVAAREACLRALAARGARPVP